jgi:predicted tellurium resistance membrane protein TerC
VLLAKRGSPIFESLLPLLTDPAAWAALAALIVMEIVLGVDNLIFIAILTRRVEASRRAIVRRIGIGLAVVLRLGLLSMVAVIARLTTPLFTLFGHAFSWRDLILLAGGLFLVWKATQEIRHHVDTAHKEGGGVQGAQLTVASAIAQIILLDLVFSIDSIVTAVGMTDHIPIMVLAVLVSVGLMLAAAEPLSNFIGKNPTIVMLALSFLLMIGMTLIGEAFGAHIDKNYLYAAMGFSALVEALNMRARRRRSGG